MSLVPGSRLGQYEITGKLGEGGMGAVFRARDTQLGRDVAIKVLPDSFARDADRVARFRREAQALAALNDPHIAQIYQFEESAQAAALVMELVEGRTLADLIATASGGRGLAIEDALALAAQVAAGLEVAHERGIVHRDLKPANVKVTPNGAVKLLDFGLAKALGTDGASGELMNSPTLTANATEAGMLLGTAAYMSPEQARGRAVDKRTDIWAFGAVLFEMLTGRRLFEGETVSDTVAAVLRHEPDWTQLPAETPAHVRTLLARCLERDPSRRLRDIGEARVALETARAPVSVAGPIRELSPGASSSTPPGSVAPIVVAPPETSRRWQVAAAIFALTTAALAAVLLWTATRQPAASPATSMELAIAAPPDGQFAIGSNSGNVVLSPDGTRIAFVASRGGSPMIWIRSLSADDARPLSGTERALYPFWSPDSRRVGFFAIGTLYVVDIAGGVPEAIAAIDSFRGAAWGRDGTIVFAGISGGALSRVTATGGPVTPLTRLDLERGENAHYWPVWLPDGQRFLYYVRSSRSPDINGIYVARLDGSSPAMRVVASQSSGILAPDPSTGALYLLWARDGELLAQPFDAESATLQENAVVVASDVRVEESQRLAFVSASSTGVLAWATARATTQVFSLYGRDGRLKRSLDIPPGGRFDQIAFSPDGRRLLYQRIDRGSSDIYVHDLQSRITRPVVITPDFDELGSWTPDSRAILYVGGREGRRSLHKISADGGTPQPVTHADHNVLGDSQETPDGRFVIFTQSAPGNRNIMAVATDGSTPPVTLLSGAAADALSGDGRWLVMSTNRGGRISHGVARLYIDGATPRLGALVPIENAFAIRRDGREVFARTPSRELLAFPFATAGDSVTVGAPQTIAKMPAAEDFVVNGDGTEFVALEQPYSANQTLRVVTNWPARLAGRK